MKNQITLEQAKKEGYILTEYSEKYLKEKLDSLKHFEGIVKIIPYLDVKNDIEQIKNYHDIIDVYVEFKGILLRPFKRYNETSFEFSLLNGSKTDIKHDLVMPNKVGKPTIKKMDDWLSYLQAVEVLKNIEQNEIDEKTNAFLTRIQNTGLEVHNSVKGGKKGSLRTEDVEYFFEIGDNGHVYEKITLRCGSKLDDFLRLVK
jgi:hypothetical protein